MVTKSGERLLYEDLTYRIRGACFNIWKEFGGAFKEKVIDRALTEELKSRGLKIENQKPIDIYYKGKKIASYVPDKIVNDLVLLEIKCKPFLTKEDERQFWYYLKGSNYKIGLLINFGSKKLEIKRRVYDRARLKNLRVNPRLNPRLSASTNKGFTLTELLVVIAVISILSAIILPSYRTGERQFALQRSAYKVAQDIRMAQEMAMSAKEFPGAPASFKGSYGINFQINSTSYTLFADLNENKIFDSGEAIENPTLEKRIRISNLSPSSPLNITFSPPDPTININPSDSLATITLTNDIQTKNIKINKAGLIYVE